MSTIDKMISGIGANIDQSAANNEALHEIVKELKLANRRHKRIESYAWWCASLAQLAFLLALLAIIAVMG